ncbi:MAG: ABC transporter ATP-binding protein, partial [Planctomycetes bacterium]|nr:ABC transporter ATP-binding protein [Planctomycetota bacterium]
MDNPAIEVWNLSKTYRLYGNPWHRVLESLPGAKRQRHKAVHALKDVNFHVPSGTCVGLVGGNGAGKSTLLKILTGTTFPTGGGFRIRGRIASLLELGAGFNRDFTGKENIFMNAALMGFSRREAMKKYDEILDFSELGEFIHAPIRTYSSGMVCRLGFSVAVATDPDVLIIDEILAVGDMHFRRKCVDRIMSYRERGKTMFFCSHSLYDVRQICDRAVWMKNGEVKMFDDSVIVTNEYATYENTLTAEAEKKTPWDDEDAPKPMHSDDHARVVKAELVDPVTRKPRNVFSPRDDIAVRV